MAIGQKLEDARNRKGISIREASESTKIRGDFLSSFEAGNFNINLPEVYLRGFIRVYARFLGIDPESAVADLKLEIGTEKNKNNRKPIGKIGGAESGDNNQDIVSVDKPITSTTSLSASVSSRKTFLFIGIAGSVIIALAIILIVIFSASDQGEEQLAEDRDQLQTGIRETSSLSQSNFAETDKPNVINSDSIVAESTLRLAAFGPIERLIISDEGKSPKVFHEFKNIEAGWEKSIPFSNAFRCYSSSLEFVRFAVDNGLEKQVKGSGAGNFSWSAKQP